MNDIRTRDLLAPAVLGGLCGLLLQTLIATVSESFWGHMTPAFFFNLSGLAPHWVGNLITTALMFAFGAAAGMAALPFAGSGRALLLRSLLHFAAVCLTAAAWVCLNFGWRELPVFLIPLALLYLLLWLGRWALWCAGRNQIREKLGIAPEPSPLRWRETLPHLGYALLLCGLLPWVLYLCDPPDVPALTAILMPPLLTIAGFAAGFSLGRKEGFCPLYPLSCGLCSLPLALSVSRVSRVLPFCAFCPALLGSLLGTLVRRWRRNTGNRN